jgi:hypothetical protein
VDPVMTERLRASKRGPVRMFHRNGYFGPPVDGHPPTGAPVEGR